MWLSLTCPLCRVKFRIREEYAHLRGRCPDCGARIEAPRPQRFTRPAPVVNSDEPLGLAPIEEEWPEPGLIEEENSDPLYEVKSAPSIWPDETRPEVPGDTNIYGVGEYRPTTEPAAREAKDQSEPGYGIEGDDLGTPPAPPPPPPELPITYRLSDAELKPKRVQPPPPRAFFKGVYGFPWRPAHLKALCLLWFGFSLVHLLGWGVLVLGGFMDGQNPSADPMTPRFTGVGMAGLLMALIWIFIWTGSYAAETFAVVFQETAAGNDEVSRAEGSWREWFFNLLRLLWLFGLASLVPMWLLRQLGLPRLPALALTPVLFTLFLFSAFTSGHFWSILHGRVLQSIAARPGVFVQTCLHSSVVLAGGYGALYLTQYLWFGAAPVVGLVFAAGTLLYARILGRGAFLLTWEPEKPRKNASTSADKRPRRKPIRTGTSALPGGPRPEASGRRPARTRGKPLPPD